MTLRGLQNFFGGKNFVAPVRVENHDGRVFGANDDMKFAFAREPRLEVQIVAEGMERLNLSAAELLQFVKENLFVGRRRNFSEKKMSDARRLDERADFFRAEVAVDEDGERANPLDGEKRQQPVNRVRAANRNAVILLHARLVKFVGDNLRAVLNVLPRVLFARADDENFLLAVNRFVAQKFFERHVDANRNIFGERNRDEFVEAGHQEQHVNFAAHVFDSHGRKFFSANQNLAEPRRRNVIQLAKVKNNFCTLRNKFNLAVKVDGSQSVELARDENFQRARVELRGRYVHGDTSQNFFSAFNTIKKNLPQGAREFFCREKFFST